MNCADVQQRIHRSLDGELGGPEAGEMEAHLEGCAACRALHDELASLLDLVLEVGRTDRVDPLAKAHPSPRRGRVRGAAAAAILLAAITAFAVVGRLGRPGAVRPAPVAGSPVAEASLELSAEAADSMLVVRMPSRRPDLHIFWLYSTEH